MPGPDTDLAMEMCDCNCLASTRGDCGKRGLDAEYNILGSKEHNGRTGLKQSIKRHSGRPGLGSIKRHSGRPGLNQWQNFAGCHLGQGDRPSKICESHVKGPTKGNNSIH